MNLYEKLAKIQVELKAPKNQVNAFAGFNYRNCEDIIEAFKPYIEKYKVTLIINDTLELIGERYYVKATAILYDCESEQSVGVSAYAREEESINSKGMTNPSQITGSTSSYARKYALDGLLCIDDSSYEIDGQQNTPIKEQPRQTKNKYKLSEAQVKRLLVIGSMAGYTADQVLKRCKEKYGVNTFEDLNKTQYDEVCTKLENKSKEEVV